MTSGSPEFKIPQHLVQLLSQELEPALRQSWHQSVSALDGETRGALLELLSELADHSTKAAALCLRKWEWAARSLSPKERISWVDLGVALAAHSSATALKYFQDSLAWINPLSGAQREAVFEAALDLADRNYGVVLDFLRASSPAMAVLPVESLPLWMEPGLALAEEDIVLAVEYFRISPSLLSLLALRDLERWVRLGMRLVTPNQFGKPDYLKAIEYFRQSPEIFSMIDPPDLRRPFLDLAAILASGSPTMVIEFLRRGPALLRGLPTAEVRRKVLESAVRLADQSPEVVADYLKQVPQVLDLMNHSIPEFESWVETGLRLVSRHLEKGRAYFNRRSKMGQETTERLAGGVQLSNVSRILRLYAEGLSGRPVLIRPVEDLPPEVKDRVRYGPTTDGRAIYLPERVRFFPEPQDNYRFYIVATLHEVGHLEFGTYDLDFSSLNEPAQRLSQKHGKSPIRMPVATAEAFFSLFPDPAWARTLWEILEDARTDYLLRWQYPGIRLDMDRIIAFELGQRPSLSALPPRLAIREALLQLSITDNTEVPIEMAPVISKAYDLIIQLKRPTASALDSIMILETLYELVESWLTTVPKTEGEVDPLKSRDTSGREESLEDQEGRDAASSLTLSYRGTMHPDWVRASTESGAERPLSPGTRIPGQDLSSEPSPLGATRSVSSDLNEASREESFGAESAATTAEGSDERAFLYDEWDSEAQEYRPGWVRLMETRFPSAAGPFLQETLARYGQAVRLLRRYFEAIRPEAYRKLRRQVDGEEMDLDALLEARIEALTGHTPTDRIYTKTEKRMRDVAVAFLLDMSGSTSRYIGRTGKRVVDIEKEGLVLLSEALEAVGDTYGIFGFSGQGRERAEFYILKDFHEPARPVLSDRIGSIKPLAQNRDGTAIRHAVHKLLEQPSRTRLLILLSDGKPLDSDYAGGYALQDTKKALREARDQGVHPYCITIDREASDYVTEMYGDIRYTIIDNVLTLPDRLPQIYRRLTT